MLLFFRPRKNETPNRPSIPYERGVKQMNPNKKSVIIQEKTFTEEFHFPKVDLFYQGENYVLVRGMLRETKTHIKKLPGNQYQILRTGEIFEMSENTGKVNHNLAITFEKLRGLIRTNFTKHSKNQSFITLTYRENMTDPKKAYKDFEQFWKRLQRYRPGHKLDYISVIEPQARGAWHFHVLVKSDQESLWIDKWRLKDIWGHGNAYIEALKSDDVGNYFVTYFTCLYENEESLKKHADKFKVLAEEYQNEEGVHDPEHPERMKILNKQKFKGRRLHFYPKHLKFFRCSRGIKHPEKQATAPFEFEQMKLDGEVGKKAYSKTFSVVVDDKEVQAIQKTLYRRNKNV
jgi:hypothetical protein